jgi:NAD(P)-dependent dehydrogenase (short-subunit alcohol dehydrogenase family)
MGISEQRTADRFELQLAVNHLGHFALTALLLPALRGPTVHPRLSHLASIRLPEPVGNPAPQHPCGRCGSAQGAGPGGEAIDLRYRCCC